MTNDQLNLPKYEAAYGYIDEAIAELESAHVGLDKGLFGLIGDIVRRLQLAKQSISYNLIDKTQELISLQAQVDASVKTLTEAIKKADQ